MDVYVNVKQIGKRSNVIEKQPFTLENIPLNIEELITETVKTCVKEHNKRVSSENDVRVLSGEEMKAAESVGKIAFGSLLPGKRADIEEAQQNALQCFKDGVFRIFIDENMYDSLDTRIDLSSDSVITFIKMTMVMGGIL